MEFFISCILISQFHVKKNQTPSPIDLTEKLNIEKWYFNTGAYGRPMTEAPTRIIFMLRTKFKKLQTVSRVR